MWITSSVDWRFGVELALLDQAAAHLVDDRRLLDADRAGLDAGVALHARPDRLHAHAVLADDRDVEHPFAVAVAAASACRARRRRRRSAWRALACSRSSRTTSRGESGRPGRVGRAGLVALAALRAGVELEQVHGAEVARASRSPRARSARSVGIAAQPLAGLGSLSTRLREAREHVGRLGVRDRGDERDRQQAVEPPDRVRASSSRRAVAEARGLRDACGGHPAERREARCSRAVHRDPDALEQVAGDARCTSSDPEEDPVADAVDAAVVLRRRRGARSGRA